MSGTQASLGQCFCPLQLGPSFQRSLLHGLLVLGRVHCCKGGKPARPETTAGLAELFSPIRTNSEMATERVPCVQYTNLPLSLAGSLYLSHYSLCLVRARCSVRSAAGHVLVLNSLSALGRKSPQTRAFLSFLEACRRPFQRAVILRKMHTT